MAVETKRGCGYRFVGGMYLVGEAVGIPCDRLPVALDICPTCGAGIRRSRGFTWVDVAALVQGPHVQNGTVCAEGFRGCTFCADPESMGRAGLIWVGEQFYPSTNAFLAEGSRLGFSRRITAVPRGFEIGKTFVLLAHAHAIRQAKLITSSNFVIAVDNIIARPGIFYVWRPRAVEKLVLESQRGTESITNLVQRGITPVFIPDYDRDHNPVEGGAFQLEFDEGGEV